jgi:hypothetical protein
MIFGNDLPFSFGLVDLSTSAPVYHTRDVLFVTRLGTSIWFFKFLHLGTILDVYTVDAAFLVPDENFTVSLVEAHRSDVFSANVSKNALEAAICCVPDFDALWVSGYKRVEDWIVKDAETCLIVGEVVVSRFVVVIEEHPSTPSDDTLGWRRDSETVYLVCWAVECLHG